MAEFLIFSQNDTNPDIQIDQSSCYKFGDPVVVNANGHAWGKEEHPSTTADRKFWLIQIPNISEVAVEQLIEPLIQPEGEGIEILLRRQWKFDATQLSQTELDTLNTVGILVLNWEQARLLFINKTTNQPPSIN
jgi:hypothetical protein